MNENAYLKQIRRLALGLAFSGACNIAFLALFFYWAISENPLSARFELKPASKEEMHPPLAAEISNSEIIRSFRLLPMDQLTGKLNNSKLAENGYTYRDLALACLAAFHHLDLSRALRSQPIEERVVAYGKRANGTPAQIVVYPGLTEQHFQCILDFIKTERWPQTPKGLYLLLKKTDSSNDPSLLEAFILTPEYEAVNTLFSRAETAVPISDLVNMLLEGDWKTLSSFTASQRQVQDLSPARRQRLLLDYIEQRSASAAAIMLKTDETFASKKLDDRHIIALLDLLEVKTPEAEKFALTLLASPRRDAVLQKAAERLYEYAGEAKPEQSIHQAALRRFLPKNAVIHNFEKASALKGAGKSGPLVSKQASVLPQKCSVTGRKKEGLYTIQEGDSLWKISRRFKVDIELLRQVNQLESDFLKPGTTLKIPL